MLCYVMLPPLNKVATYLPTYLAVEVRVKILAGFEPGELNRLSKDTRHAGTLSVNLRREPPILKLPSHLLTRDGSISQANDRCDSRTQTR